MTGIADIKIQKDAPDNIVPLFGEIVINNGRVTTPHRKNKQKNLTPFASFVTTSFAALFFFTTLFAPVHTANSTPSAELKAPNQTQTSPIASVQNSTSPTKEELSRLEKTLQRVKARVEKRKTEENRQTAELSRSTTTLPIGQLNPQAKTTIKPHIVKAPAKITKQPHKKSWLSRVKVAVKKIVPNPNTGYKKVVLTPKSKKVALRQKIHIRPLQTEHGIKSFLAGTESKSQTPTATTARATFPPFYLKARHPSSLVEKALHALTTPKERPSFSLLTQGQTWSGPAGIKKPKTVVKIVASHKKRRPTVVGTGNHRIKTTLAVATKNITEPHSQKVKPHIVRQKEKSVSQAPSRKGLRPHVKANYTEAQAVALVKKTFGMDDAAWNALEKRVKIQLAHAGKSGAATLDPNTRSIDRDEGQRAALSFFEAAETLQKNETDKQASMALYRQGINVARATNFLLTSSCSGYMANYAELLRDTGNIPAAIYIASLASHADPHNEAAGALIQAFAQNYPQRTQRTNILVEKGVRMGQYGPLETYAQNILRAARTQLPVGTRPQDIQNTHNEEDTYGQYLYNGWKPETVRPVTPPPSTAWGYYSSSMQ